MKLTTEQKLDQYYQSRGIDKKQEKETTPIIQKVLNEVRNTNTINSKNGNKVLSAKEAIDKLEKILDRVSLIYRYRYDK